MRIEDPTGAYIISKEDPRVMVKADPIKGKLANISSSAKVSTMIKMVFSTKMASEE
jgi:hypothetical protein